MAEFIPVCSFDIVIFGGTGDLSRRKLLPALYHRWADGQIPQDARIIGVSRSQMSDEAFKAFAHEACEDATPDKLDKAKWKQFEQHLSYVTMDATDTRADWQGLKQKLVTDADRPCIFYLAVTPKIYVPICEALGKAGLAKGNARIVLEKPIGTDLQSARQINTGVGAVFAEDRIYRIDHYLGKETVQNLLVLRFANSLFEPLWNRSAIDHIQITVAEHYGVGERAGYYDSSGALRDMVQNHILQLLCLIMMEPPNSIDGDAIRTEKIKVLQALRPITVENVNKDTVRAQYTSGNVEGEPVDGYLDELGRSSSTETFVAIKASVDNWRWARVPVYLRTGKRMKARHSEIVVRFRPTPHAMFGAQDAQSNRLVINVQPDEGVQLYLQIKEPGPGGLKIKSLPLNLSYQDNFMVRYPDAYERLLMDVVRGNLSLFMRREEVEAAWQWVDGLIAAWEQADTPMRTYTAGVEDGPIEAKMMMHQDDREWWNAGT
ncbi:MAG: glucose-6-phosphate dehydrogenase [Henriciella sp.]|nr:glucose-6-phosphate dehydrogenase [Henriciella sp.]